PRGFRKSAEREGEDVIAHERRRCIAERERVEDFVGNDRQAEARDRILFGRADVGAGGIIRVDDEYGARALGYYLSDAAGVDVPALVKFEREVAEVDQLQGGEMFQQRIRRLRRQHRIARIAEELEEKRVGLAGRG